ncbi:MAG: helix-turn-helix domain-containing protein [Candidatus Methylomirabilales bacterium]
MAELADSTTNVSQGLWKRYLRIDEVAQYLGISRRTVYRLIEEEKLETVKIRGCSRVRWDDLQRFEADLDGAKESV